MEPSVGIELERTKVADRVWEEVLEIYGHEPRIVHTSFTDLRISGRDERAEILSKILEIVPKEKLVSFIPIALWPDLDRVHGNWNTALLKILLRCLNQSISESRRKRSSSTLRTNVEVPAFGPLKLQAALPKSPQDSPIALVCSAFGAAQDEMSETRRSNAESRLRQSPPPPPPSSSPPIASANISLVPKDPTAKAPSPSPPPPPPVLDADEDLKHQIAIARAKRDYRRIIDQESTEQERMSLQGRRCLLEETEFDLEAQKAEQVLEDGPFEKDVVSDPDPGMSRKRKIGALEVERAERKYEVAKAAKLERKT